MWAIGVLIRGPCSAPYTGIMGFRLAVNYRPRGDQETAIAELTRGVREGEQHQVLLGVTGSGKTFTMAKVIEAIGRPGRQHHDPSVSTSWVAELNRFAACHP